MNRKSEKPFPKIFISYARDDLDKARHIASKLKNRGLDIWLDKEDFHTGENWQDRIENAIKTCDIVLVLVSSNALSSRWVNKEWSVLCEEKWKRPDIKIIPIKLEDLKIPAFLSEYNSYSTKDVRSDQKIAKELFESEYFSNKKESNDEALKSEIVRLESRFRELREELMTALNEKRDSHDD